MIHEINKKGIKLTGVLPNDSIIGFQTINGFVPSSVHFQVTNN